MDDDLLADLDDLGEEQVAEDEDYEMETNLADDQPESLRNIAGIHHSQRLQQALSKIKAEMNINDPNYDLVVEAITLTVELENDMLIVNKVSRV
jgi:hypothetical protein